MKQNSTERARANEFEQLLLGALMIKPTSFWIIDDLISEDTFATKSHSEWFLAIKKRVEKNDDIDTFLIAADLENSNASKPDSANWAAYIGEIIYKTPSSTNILSYAKRVYQYHLDRLSVITGTSILDVLKNTQTDSAERLNQSEALLASLGTRNKNKHRVRIQTALTCSVEELENHYNNDGKIWMSYGFESLDELTQGAHQGDLIYIAGRPSMGKTALGMNFAEFFCQQGKAGLVCSMEMSSNQLAGRLITSVGQIDAQRFRSGKLIDDDWNKMTYALSKMSDHQLFVDENSQATPSSVRGSARRAKQEFGKLDFIMIDYLQMMQTDGKRINNRSEEIAEISRQLKLIAKEFNAPVFVLSQLNRNLEQRPNKRPMMSDLRESGSIEQDADMILFIYRDEVYNSDSEFKGTAEIIIGKQRNGPIGSIHVAFLGAYSKFRDL